MTSPLNPESSNPKPSLALDYKLHVSLLSALQRMPISFCAYNEGFLDLVKP